MSTVRKSDTFIWRVWLDVYLRWSRKCQTCFHSFYDDKDLRFYSTTAANYRLTTSREVTRYIIAESFQFVDKNYNIISERGQWKNAFANLSLPSLVNEKGRDSLSLTRVINQSMHLMLSPMTTPLTSRRNQFRIYRTRGVFEENCFSRIAERVSVFWVHGW